MRTRLLLLLAVSCTLALSGCITINTVPGAQSPVTTPDPTSVATPNPTPIAAPTLTATIDGIVYAHDNMSELSPYSDGQKIVNVFATVTGVMPKGEFIGSYYQPDVQQATRFTWPGATVDVYTDDGSCDIRILAPVMNGVPVKTKEGISVGSTIAQITAAGGWNARPGFQDSYGLQKREVPGTSSLAHPGAVGIDYVGLFLEKGKVTQIVLLTNDYGDL